MEDWGWAGGVRVGWAADGAGWEGASAMPG